MTDALVDMRGHNAPPSDIEILRDRLQIEAAAITRRRDELLTSSERVPATISDDEMAGRVADLIKLITACYKAAETMRVGAKEPFLESGRAVDGFYKRITDPLISAKKKIEGALTIYQRRKEEKERRRREDAAAKARAEAERAAREAAEKAAALKTDNDLAAALTAEALAQQARYDAAAASGRATVKAAELSRNRGDYGAVASLRTEWVGELVSRDELDLQALRPHIPIDALEKAIRSFVRAGGRELRGAKIYERTISVVR